MISSLPVTPNTNWITYHKEWSPTSNFKLLYYNFIVASISSKLIRISRAPLPEIFAEHMRFCFLYSSEENYESGSGALAYKYNKIIIKDHGWTHCFKHNQIICSRTNFLALSFCTHNHETSMVSDEFRFHKIFIEKIQIARNQYILNPFWNHIGKRGCCWVDWSKKDQQKHLIWNNKISLLSLLVA